MKLRTSKIVILSSLLALATTVSFSKPSYAEGTKFYCHRVNGKYFTFARTEDGRKYRVIRWNSTDFPAPYSPEARCREVSSRFQRNYDHGTLKKIVSGIINKQPVICSGSDSNTVCNSRNLLFTLKPGANRKAVAAKLFDKSALAAGKIDIQTGDPEDIMFDFDIYFDNLASE
ncbi:MAG: COP23 domain-containing protein [Sphaerospermopsis sp.]|jgi:hypothetical protein|uniref:Uncharacterized protein n=2 Tax=Sphaerospermopsis TaxID=752201 RepID=A0A480A9L0_9CYAN|nr:MULTISPECIES: COP23 domain-containing protein [Sphaerospermopsis]MBD2135379.1 hypothetical protein [Sphaerospermopsis sp. FACHB-1094]MBE9237498.1 hypothetical protein [Sphaerospermopsis aphanizomenoides LEGE 00250]MEB3151358.1 COP23 domain-containing protein [Sphaerospermopsis sp.]GCL39958.1 hypothetical protein SR1949_50890 [Sphaerospermopsis reniformis]